MKIISLDQSIRSTGATIYKDGRLSFKLLGAPKEIKDIIQQLKYAILEIQELVLQERPDILLIEGLPYGLNSSSVRPLAHLYFSLLAFADYWGMEARPISITKAKRAAGKGSMKKEAMWEMIPSDIQKAIFQVVFNKKQRLDISDSYWILQAFLKQESE